MYFAIFVVLTSAWIANGAEFTWEIATSLPTTAAYPSVVFDDNDSIYLLGGSNSTGYNDKVFKYSVSTGQFETHGQFMPLDHVAAVINTGKIYCFGGSYVEEVYTDTISRYSLTTSEHVVLDSSLPVPVHGQAIIGDPPESGDTLYIFGGHNVRSEGGGYKDNIFRYSVLRDELTELGTTLPIPISGAKPVRVSEAGIVYLFGGFLDGARQPSLLQFDPRTGIVSRLPDLPVAFGQGCAVYANSAVYVIHNAGFMKFHPETGLAEELGVDKTSWPVFLDAIGCVYVEKEDRIYVLGGKGYFEGESENRLLSDIAYIQLDGEHQQEPSSTTEFNGAGTIQVGFVVYSFFVSLTSLLNKFN